MFLSARDGAKELRTHKDNVGRWLDELTHYGFLVMLCGPHLGVDGDGQSAHYRLTDRWFHGQAPTRDFDKWSGEIFRPEKRVYSDAEKARLNELKKQKPRPTGSDTPSDSRGHKDERQKAPDRQTEANDKNGVGFSSFARKFEGDTELNEAEHKVIKVSEKVIEVGRMMSRLRIISGRCQPVVWTIAVTGSGP